MPDKSAPGQLPIALFVDDDKDFLGEIRQVAVSTGLCEVVTLSDSSQLLAELEKGIYSVLFMDWVMPVVTGADLLPVIVQRYPLLPVIIMTGISDINTVVGCMKLGAMDYVTKPLDANRLVSCLTNALKILELSAQNRQLQEYLLGTPLSHPENFSNIISESGKMMAIFKLIETISSSRYPVFITGETGVGKELIASAVHRASGLKGEFVPLNIAGLDPLMFDDTLFGHRKGAFTGASEMREGLIAKAQGGTLFLDEIGDLNHQSQVKLLRLLQENEYYRLGSDLIQKSDARIIVASNRNFEDLICTGAFREDLFHRLCYHRIHIPPLRERREDIIPLVKYFCAQAAKNVGKTPPGVATELQYLLCDYDYPGNVRELINRVSNAVVVNRTGLLTQEEFPDIAARDKGVLHAEGCGHGRGHYSLHVMFPDFPTLAQVERLMVHEALKRSGGVKSTAADLLGITRQTLKKKMDEIEGIEGIVAPS